MSASPENAPAPNYIELARFLLQPFLDSPDSLKVDAEYSHGKTRVLIRVAFAESEDRGRIFGRGGRNIKAVTTTLEGVAKAAGQSARLEIFGLGDALKGDGGRRPSQRDSRPRPKPKPKQSE